MGRAHGPRDPRERRPVWEPEPLHVPVDRPPTRSRNPHADDDASTDDGGDRTGSYVVVIDLA